MRVALDTPNTDFIFGLAGNRILSPLAQPFMAAARVTQQTRCELAQSQNLTEPSATHTYHDLEYHAKTWPKAFRVVFKAEVLTLGDNPRFVVTSLGLPSPESIYRDLYCARGQDENWIKMIKNDLSSDLIRSSLSR